MPTKEAARNSQVKKKAADAIAALEALAPNFKQDEEILYEGQRYVLPKGSSLKEAIRVFTKKIEDEDNIVLVQRRFNYRPWDGAYCFLNACVKHFGMTTSKRFRRDMFGNPSGSQWVDINTSHNQTTSVPWGEIYIPAITPDYSFYLGGQNSESGPLFNVQFEGPGKFRRAVEGLFELVQRELEINSLYRGKAFDGAQMPNFLDLSGVDEERIVYPADAWRQLRQNIFSVFEYSDRLALYGIPLKRAVLLEGPYGTGKTIGGYLTALKATQNNWTFIYCRPGQDDLEEVLSTARLYQPAVVFAEDLDVVAGTEDGERSHISKMLDAFDGIRAKGTELMVVLTTNHVEKLHKGMVRPGRLDGVISLGRYDPPAIRRLIEVTVGDILDNIEESSWDEVGVAYNDLMPAFIVEAAQRAIRYAVPRDAEPLVSAQDLIDAANGLRPQLDLMEQAPEALPRDRLGGVLHDLSRAAAVEGAMEALEEYHS